jgi:hypothetical protein
MSRFKGMHKDDMDPGCLLHKYEMEMTMLKKFAYTFPDFVSLNKLPSRTPQLQHLWQPVVTKLWVASNPVSHILHLLYWFSSPDILSTRMFLQGIEGLNYDDPVAVAAMIPSNWWLEHKSCKYILSVLVHKDNKDIVTNPTKQPSGPTHKKVREKSKKLIAEERAVDRLDCQVEVQDDNGAVKTIKLGDVEIDTKRVQVDGMRSVIEKNMIDSIERKITIMQKMEQIYVGRFGREWYKKQLLNLVNQLPGMLDSGGEGDGGVADQTTTPQSGSTGTFSDMNQ